MAMADDVWEALAQDLPSASDPFLQQYLAGRDGLVGRERAARADASFRAALSPVARRACAVVDAIRAREQATVWAPDAVSELSSDPVDPVSGPASDPDSASGPDPDPGSSSDPDHGPTGSIPGRDRDRVFPGMMFMFAKARMERTLLWRIVRRMPKGCLLHAHMDAMVDFDFLLDQLLRTPGMHVASDRALASARARDRARLAFRFRAAPRRHAAAASIWDDAAYEPDAFLPLADVADAFPAGGRRGFLDWLKGRCVLSLVDSHEHHHGVDAIWQKLNHCFSTVATFIHYEPMFRAFLRRLMHVLMADGVAWAELRFTWGLDFCREGREEPETDYSHMFRVLEEEVARFKASDEGRGFWGLVTIWTSMRSSDTRRLVESMDHCITTKMEFPRLIAGYDLVGPEDLGKPLVDMLPELFWFRQQCAQEGVNIPFFFHAGETLGDGSSTDHNLFDAVLLGTRRIGHAFSLYKHPLLIDMVKEKQILVESCPVSNEVLRLCGSITSHPLPALLARGVACCLCNDDPAMLGQGTAGMSHDFWQALQGWDNLGLAGLGSLAENSVRWAALEDQDAAQWSRDVKQASLGAGLKAQRLKEWRVEWEKFCLWIVTEFGDELDESDGVDGDCDVDIDEPVVAAQHAPPLA